jgi:serine/threonine-protein kinase
MSRSNEPSALASGKQAPEADAAIPWFAGAGAEAEAGATSNLPPLTPGSAGSTVMRAAAPRNARHRDEGELARGAMGSIRKLFDTQMRRRVALKLINPRLAADPSLAQRFIDEARVTGALDHPNIVPVHDLMVEDPLRASYTMKLVAGRTLSELITGQKSRRDVERILETIVSVCNAVSFAHSRGIVHRDLKPDNIMVGDFGEVYVMDWGCAYVRGDRGIVDGAPDDDGTVLGTVQYMAPEQARGEVASTDARTDVFAIGAILYKVLTGRAPYVGPLETALAAAERGDYRPIDDSTAGVAVMPPPKLTQIVKKAMAFDPNRRYQSATDLAEALRAFMRGGDWNVPRIFPAGTAIVREGDRADAAFIIESGRCEVRKRDPDNPERHTVLRVLVPGDVFGEAAIFADVPRSASVVALDDVRAVVIERAELERWVASGSLGKFVKSLADRFLELDQRLQQAARGMDLELPG